MRMMTVEEILLPVEPSPPDTTGAEMYERFAASPDLAVVPLVEEGRTIGLVERPIFLMNYARPFRRELYAHRPVVKIINVGTIMMECDTPVHDATQIIADRSATKNN